jgi:prepilin-type N-terminal cleavage/methylation domain-containing protein
MRSIVTTQASGTRPFRSGGGRHAAGFTLVEALVVVALVSLLAGIALPITADMVTRAKASSTSVEVVAWLEEARSRATAERRNFQLTFDLATHRVRVDRIEADLSVTTVIDRPLPDRMQFMQFAGVGDTPDLFGNSGHVEFDGPAPHMFTSEGSLVDANGDPSNGTIFLGRERELDTGRAITVFGVTGLLRTWKLAGKKWMQ